MKIKGVDLSGFRAFARPESLDLDADVVVLLGANGQGKTSLFDSILWALTGTIPRLGKKDRGVVSMYSPSGEARVSLTISNNSGEEWEVIRSSDGQNQRLQIEVGGTVHRGPRATLELFNLIWRRVSCDGWGCHAGGCSHSRRLSAAGSRSRIC